MPQNITTGPKKSGIALKSNGNVVNEYNELLMNELVKSSECTSDEFVLS